MLKDDLEDIYQQVGRHNDQLFSHTFEGAKGKAIIDDIMKSNRNNPPRTINGLDVLAIEDYETGEKLISKQMKQHQSRSLKQTCLKYILKKVLLP